MKFFTAGFIIMLFAIAGCASHEKQLNDAGKPVTVTLNKMADSDTGNLVSASGKLVAKNTANVSTRMMGYITGFHVQVGQQVQAGQLLVNVNNTDIVAKGGQVSAQIAQAQANLNSAQKDYERFQNLYNLQSATAKELDDMRTRYEMAKAGLTAAQQMKNEVNAQFSYSNITAPISGVVTQTYVKQGDMASPGMPLLTIEAPSQLQADVLVPETEITQIKKGMPVKVHLKSTGEITAGTVAEISLSASNTGGQYAVKVNLISPSKNLLPGMFVNVQFALAKKQDAGVAQTGNIIVPESALVHYGQLTGIYTVSSNNTAVLRWLRVGNKTGNEVEVLSGLNASETYIISAEGKLYNGVKVTVK
ncbi:MAG: efflux RND transporter periplasmic adaptor subunit [Ferruginibacter sp.]